MTDAAATTTATPAAKPWTFTAPAKDAVAWTGATYYSDDKCTTAKTDTKWPAEAKVQVAYADAALFVQALSDKEVHIATTFDAAKTTYADTELTKIPYTLADVNTGADSACVKVKEGIFMKAKVGGWAAPAADDTTAASAKTLGAAFAAAALAVAATQF